MTPVVRQIFALRLRSVWSKSSEQMWRHETITNILPFCRTKWKRQTSVTIELLAEATGNYAAMQRMLQWNFPGIFPVPTVPVYPTQIQMQEFYYRSMMQQQQPNRSSSLPQNMSRPPLPPATASYFPNPLMFSPHSGIAEKSASVRSTEEKSEK